MKRICSFCNTALGPSRPGDQRITHGICQTCYQNIRATLGVDIREYLEMLDCPVLMVDDDVRVLALNEKARQFLKKEDSGAVGYYTGEVFECENARLPGGCGKTIHCSACVIRGSVNEAYRTGAEVVNRPAILNQGIPGASLPAQLLISAKREGDVVLLKVEPAPSAFS